MDDIPYLIDIKGHSLDDGPGIRSVIFFKGCPLSCFWCHNPESQHSKPELAFDAKNCHKDAHCDRCISVCSQDALAFEKKLVIERNKCNSCFDCVSHCSAQALTIIGKQKTVSEIVNTLRPYFPFYKNSKGGITLSGGEFSLYTEFSSQLLQAFKKEQIHTLVETCGYFSFEKFMLYIFPFVDTIYYDIKIFDSSEHKKYCGTDNRLILENFKKLAEVCMSKEKVLLPRVPLVPGITTGDENLAKIAEFLHSSNVQEAELLSYNPTWSEKNAKLGRKITHIENKSWMKQEEIDHCKEVFDLVISNVV